jgi:hypothetical protein
VAEYYVGISGNSNRTDRQEDAENTKCQQKGMDTEANRLQKQRQRLKKLNVKGTMDNKNKEQQNLLGGAGPIIKIRSTHLTLPLAYTDPVNL